MFKGKDAKRAKELEEMLKHDPKYLPVSIMPVKRYANKSRQVRAYGKNGWEMGGIPVFYILVDNKTVRFLKAHTFVRRDASGYKNLYVSVNQVAYRLTVNPNRQSADCVPLAYLFDKIKD